jgi:uncharacterized protein YfaT (DUF1175 family)
MNTLAETRKQQAELYEKVRAEKKAARAEKLRAKLAKQRAEFPEEVNAAINGIVDMAGKVAANGESAFSVWIAVNKWARVPSLFWTTVDPAVTALVAKWKRVMKVAIEYLVEAGYYIQYRYDNYPKSPEEFQLGGHPDLAGPDDQSTKVCILEVHI